MKTNQVCRKCQEGLKEIEHQEQMAIEAAMEGGQPSRDIEYIRSRWDREYNRVARNCNHVPTTPYYTPYYRPLNF